MKAAEQKECLLNILKTQNIADIEEFIKSGGNINIKLNNAKQSILDMAVYENKIDLVRSLIKNGADVNSVTYSGSTPVFSVKSLEVAELLINSGANLNAEDKKGQNILHYHISSKAKEITAYLSQKMGEHWSEEELKKVPLMPEDDYWPIVEKAYRSGKGDESIQAGNIVRALRYEDPPKIISFQKRTFQLSQYAHTSNLWAAAYVINGGCSDDSFIDFKHWVISLGRSAFYKCIEKPDKLIPYLEKKASYHDYGNIQCSSIEFAAGMAYEYRTGLNNFNRVTDYSDVPKTDSSFKLDWNEDNIESKRDIFPELWEKYR